MLIHSQRLLAAAGLNPTSQDSAEFLSKFSGLSLETIRWLHKTGHLPDRQSLRKIASAVALPEAELCKRLGFVDDAILTSLLDGVPLTAPKPSKRPAPVYSTKLGTLYEADCLAVMGSMGSETVDLIFADPPFNLSKDYPSGMDDSLKEEEYLEWSIGWLDECCRILRFGGSLFVYNLPRWNARYAEYLSRRLTFRHAVSIRMAYSLPIGGRLYPAHYSMLYLCKGPKPSHFTPDRLAMETCPKCFGDLVDYGGYKAKMNPLGVNLTDVWTDISPVRHNNSKKRKGSNELSVKLLDRIIEMASKPGDLVFDPFGGSGTTYSTAEAKGRKWVGCEVGPTGQIIERLKNIAEEKAVIKDLRSKLNSLHPPAVKREREKRGIWTSESVRNQEEKDGNDSLLFPLEIKTNPKKNASRVG